MAMVSFIVELSDGNVFGFALIVDEYNADTGEYLLEKKINDSFEYKMNVLNVADQLP